jgi:hypothetical protein
MKAGISVWPSRWAIAMAIVAGGWATAASAQILPPLEPAPAAEAVPYRPVPPGGAAYAMELPPLQADGRRTTLNSNLDANSTLWHFRSAWNVAALNCLAPEEAPILQGYAAFLKQYSRALSAANVALDQRFARELGSRGAGIVARENYMTQVYNYFALPPAQSDFCNAALAIATDYLAAPPASAGELAAANLPRYEAVFQDFYRQYQQYQVASAAWDDRWGAMFGSTQPGYVAVHGYGGAGRSLIDLNAPVAPAEVAGPLEAPRISLVAGQGSGVDVPIVQAAAPTEAR